MVSCMKKSLTKPPAKSPSKHSGKQHKGKKTSPTKSLNSSFTNKKVSPEKISKNATPKKSSSSENSKIKSVKTPHDSHIPKTSNTPPSNKKSSDQNATTLPYQRIKMIMKSCPDVEIVPQESLHVITKATELFVQCLSLESFKTSKNAVLDYEALSQLVHSDSRLEFLRETIPQKVTLAECQKIIQANAKKRDDFI